MCGPSPYRHQKFPYVPFWGKKEDRTGVPYGLVRGMMYMQDNANATNSKLRWGMADSFKTYVEGLYSANQTGVTIVMNPAVAPVADAVAEAAGYRQPAAGGVDPQLPGPGELPPPAAVDDVTGTPGRRENTSPALPPVAPGRGSPRDGSGQGIETQRTTDNAPS